MKSQLISAALAATLSVAAGAACCAAAVGQPAPAFTAQDASGKTVSLADFSGKHVVLEWVNPGCPFVQKHYDSANMQGTQKEAAAKGVVWLAVNSTATTHQDFLAPVAMSQWMSKHNAAATATLMDSDGKLGRAYGARTTPQMFIIDPAGTLVYAGGIDSKASSNPADIAVATNYVKAALGEALAGKVVSQATTRPYGCSVKYAGS